MSLQQRMRFLRITCTFLAALVILVAGAVLTTGSALADEKSDPAPTTETEASSAESTAAYSIVDLEVAAYYMSDYGGSGDLPNSYSNVSGFYYTLQNSVYHSFFGYPRWCNFSGHDCFIYGNASAWEDDWVDNNNSYIDSVDVVFYEGHGWPGGFTMRAPDDEYVQHGEVQGYWGNGDLEWAFLLSCSVLADESRGYWHGAMNYMHGIAGFRNTAYDVSGFGSTVAAYMVLGYTYKDAWFNACDTKQPSGVQAQIIVEDPKFWNESAYNQLSDVAHDGWYWYWWKSCGAEAPAHVTPAQLNQSFPIYQTPPLSLAEQAEVTSELTSAFQFPSARGADATWADLPDGTRIITDTDGRQLQIDLQTGLFYYYDANRTFAEPPAGRAGTAILSPAQAKDIADQFLTDNGIMPGDAVYNTVDNVVLGQANETSAAGTTAVISETTTGFQVIYNRYLSATTVNAAGVEQTTQIPVDGPGAKIKVYVDPYAAGAVQVATANQLGSVVGAMGGWRRIEQQGRAVEQVTLLDYQTQILPLFQSQELEPLASYESVPFPDADSKSVVTYTVSGWEEPNGESQGEIYPAYRLNAEYTRTVTLEGGAQETLVFTGSTWIAGNAAYMRPLAKFESQPTGGQTFMVGENITAMAVDASRTLADLGYNVALNFSMGDIQDPTNVLYDWYLGDIADGKKIGSGRTLNYPLQAGDIASPKGTLTNLTISLLVTNSENDNASINSSTSNFSVDVVPLIYIPQLSDE